MDESGRDDDTRTEIFANEENPLGDLEAFVSVGEDWEHGTD